MFDYNVILLQQQAPSQYSLIIILYSSQKSQRIIVSEHLYFMFGRVDVHFEVL